ncbi:MAG: hypothetical protein JWM63_4237 [Gammaproteobacteria bacterium]|nr:hypothetical protein [Gammaproteobacteria bacterium]
MKTVLLRALIRLSPLAMLAAWLAVSIAPPAALGATGRTAGHFNVSAQGEALYSIPLWTPPGTHGLAPTLSLEYSTTNANGLLGMGFALSSLSVISRCNWTAAQDGTDTVAPQPFSTTDRLCIDGNRLRQTSGSSYGAAGTYQTELESLRLITIKGADSYGPTWFEVRDGNGLTYEYGNTSDSQIRLINGGGGLSPVRLCWALNRIRDTSGNYIDFTYTEDPSRGGYYPAEIHWTGNLNTGTAPAYKAAFVNEAADRPDVIFNVLGYSGASASPHFDYYKRLSQINITHVPTGTLVRQYQLAYAPATPGGHSLLQSVTECGSGGSDCFLPTQLGWITASGTLTTGTTGQSVPAGVTPIVMDINGDGIDDLVWSSTASAGTGTWLYMLGTSSGGFSVVHNTSIANNGFTSARVLDFDGDGRADLILPYSGGTWWVMRGNSTGFDQPINTQISVVGPVTFADINGDGRDDMVYIKTGMVALRMNVGGAFGAESFPPLTYNGPATAIYSSASKGRSTARRRQDFDGDGLEDLVIQADSIDVIGQHTSRMHTAYGTGTSLRNGSDYGVVSYLGAGDFLGDGREEVVWTANGVIYTGVAPGVGLGPPGDGVVIVDWDGDGKDDLLIADYSTQNWYVARSNGPQFAASTPIGVAHTGFAWPGDFHGGGLQELLVLNGNVIQYAERSTTTPWVLRDALQNVTDAFGVSVTFAYGLLSDPAVHTPIAGPGYPLRGVTSPRGAVKSVTASDGTGPGNTYTLTVTYKGAQEDASGRGFLGFAQRTIQDSRTGQFEQVSYDQAFPLTGWVVGDNLYQADNTTLIRSTARDVRSLQLDNTANNQRALPYLYSQTAKRYEFLGNKNGNLIATTTTTYGSPDNYGNSSSVVVEVRDNDSAPPMSLDNGGLWSTTTATMFQIDTTNWCLHLPSQVQVTQVAPGASTITRTAGYAPDTAMCRETQRDTEPAPSPYSAQYHFTEHYGFDSFGNINSVARSGANVVQCPSAAPCTTTVDWGTTGQLPMKVWDASGALTQYNYNFTYGLLSSITDPNNLQTSWQYGDGFARKTQENRPDGTYTTWTYNDCVNSGGCLLGNHTLALAHYVRNTDGSIQTDGTTYFDQFDRPFLSNNMMLAGGTWDRNEVRYDNFGHVAKKAMPCTWTSVAALCPFWTTNSYDVINRLTQSQRPISASNGGLLTTGYQYLGDTTVITDANQHAKTLVTNANGWLRQTQDATGYAITLSYDAAGSKTAVNDSQGTPLSTAVYQYGIGAFMVSSTDADLGASQYTYDALGELTAWQDAKNQHFSEAYDALSRPTDRYEPDLYSHWTWGTSAAAHELGRLHSVCTGAGTSPMNCTSSPGYAENKSYDAFGRLYQRSILIPGDPTYTYTFQYSSTTGLLDTLTYPATPSGYALTLKYAYTNGIMQSITNVSDSPNVTLWTSRGMNPLGQVTQETLGNGVVVNHDFDAVTGVPNSITAGVGGGAALQNNSYLFDAVGNLTQRQDNNQGLTENAYPDALNRLDHTVGDTNTQLTFDSIGRLATWKANGASTNVNDYTTPQTGCTYYANAQPHALRKAVQGNGPPASYCYDPNGNMATWSYNGSVIWSATWTSYNQPLVMTASPSYSQFFYTQNHQRWKQVASYSGSLETTLYVGGMLEKMTNASDTAFRHYITAGNNLVVYTRRNSGSTSTYYITKDHLGSSAVVTDQSGAAILTERFSALGWAETSTATLGNVTRHEFTGHEGLDNAGFWMVNMDGRVYIPSGTRFLSPDPVIPDPTDTLSYNRYAYVNYNPLSYTDPSGFDAKPPQPQCKDATNCDFGGGGYAGGCEAGGDCPGRETVLISAGRDPFAQTVSFPWLKSLELPVTDPQWHPPQSSPAGAQQGNQQTPCPTKSSSSFLSNIIQNDTDTNASMPGLLAPTGIGFLTARATSQAWLGTPAATFGRWMFSGFSSIEVGPAVFTTLESGILVAASGALNFAVTGLTFEAGTVVGSTVSAIPTGSGRTVRDSLTNALFSIFGPKSNATELQCGW